MNEHPLPDTKLDPSLKRDIDAVARSYASVDEAEVIALTADIVAPLVGNHRWSAFCDVVTSAISNYGYIVVRGLDADEGRSLLVVSRALNLAFETYAPGRIVKRFRMSPWTNELSHTIRGGDFHTDGNVSAVPPIATAMQCEHEDPGAPEYAEQRVAYLPNLLQCLASGTDEDTEALAFLTESETALAHERSPEIWRGRLVQNGMIRYHPHSLRIASRRLKKKILEARIGDRHNSPCSDRSFCAVSNSSGRYGTCFKPNRASLPWRVLSPIYQIPNRIRFSFGARSASERARNDEQDAFGEFAGHRYHRRRCQQSQERRRHISATNASPS